MNCIVTLSNIDIIGQIGNEGGICVVNTYMVCMVYRLWEAIEK